MEHPSEPESTGDAVAFAAFIVIGWLVFACLAFGAPARLASAWVTASALPLVVQLLVWLLFLPWMLALWLTQTGWPVWLRWLLVLGLVWVTYSMAVPPLIEMIRGSR